MTYKVIATSTFTKSLKKLDRQVQKMVKAWIEKN